MDMDMTSRIYNHIKTGCEANLLKLKLHRHMKMAHITIQQYWSIVIGDQKNHMCCFVITLWLWGIIMFSCFLLVYFRSMMYGLDKFETVSEAVVVA